MNVALDWLRFVMAEVRARVLAQALHLLRPTFPVGVVRIRMEVARGVP